MENNIKIWSIILLDFFYLSHQVFYIVFDIYPEKNVITIVWNKNNRRIKICVLFPVILELNMLYITKSPNVTTSSSSNIASYSFILS